VTLANTAIKVYDVERDNLFGWGICQESNCFASDLFEGHIAQTSIGMVLVMVCHEAVLFSGRSESNLSNTLGLAIRERFRQAATTSPAPRYIAIPTHWQDERSSGTFINAASNLAEESGATVVMAMRAPKASLVTVAHRFAVQGPKSESVVTLLVEDTLIG
jgi:hypothetical protein